MTALAANTPRTYELGQRNSLPVKASTKIYEGAAVGIDASTGGARGLTAGDIFVGFAKGPADNSSGALGAVRVEVQDVGKIRLAVGSAAITDIGKPVFASDDATFTLTPTSNSYIGTITRWISTGVVMVAFDGSESLTVTALTDNSGGTAADTIAAIGGTYSQAEVRNAVASLAAKVNTLIQIFK